MAGRYIKIKGGFDFKGKNLHRNFLGLISFCNCYCKSLKYVNHSTPFTTDRDLFETVGGTLYHLGIGVAAIAMLSIAHSSVPLRILK